MRPRLVLATALLLGLAAPWLLAGVGQGSSAQTLPGVGELGGPSRPLDAAEMARWLRGRALFDRDFHAADGLGTPDYNADSCRACHQDPLLGGSGGLELNVTRLGRDAGGTMAFQDVPGGQVLSKLRLPQVPWREEQDPNADVFEQRQTPALFGAGLIDRITDAAILAHEDPADADGDGIAGRAHRVTVGAATEIGRFGWKGGMPRLVDFVHDALGGECGLTAPDDGRGFALLVDADGVSDPELSPADRDDVLFFLQNLAPPPRTGSIDPAVLAGETLFATVGCAKCHVPSLRTADGTDAFLYSDLLLHRVMPATFRGVTVPGVEVGAYRTPPLWGVRHTAPYLHDGRAETLEAAILAHDGEAAAVRAAFAALTSGDREALLRFLGDL
jgi:CxxC motif-containing protein (DUF1111 family)